MALQRIMFGMTTTTDAVRPAVRAAMRRRGWQVADLARSSGVSDSRVRAFLDGKTDVTTATLSKLMNALHLELD